MHVCAPLARNMSEMRGVCTVCRDAFRRFHIFTVPLSPTRASFLLGGRNKHMGYEAYQVRPMHPKHIFRD